MKWSIQMSNRVSKSNPLQVLFALVALALIVSLPSPLHAQTFQTVPALAFTKAFAGAEPLPQVLTIAYTDQSTVRFSTAASTNSGGSWLSISPAGNACCYTPLAVSASVVAGSLAAGTYTGQVVITNYSNATIKMTIPVTLTVAASGATFFDDLPGKLSFSFKTNGSATPQSIQIRNAGSGTLNWTLAASTADGGGWLSASVSSGAAPSTINILVTKSGLPGGGASAGTFVGQLLFQTSGDSVTIPVAVTVGTSVFTQINPLNFTMAFGGANPLAEVLNVAMTDSATVRYSASVATAKGGSWLSISPSGNACCYTPLANTVSVIPGSIAAGTYTGEIIITEFANPGRAMVVPVTLTVVSSGAFFADLPGQLSFSVKTNGTTATPQTIQVGNGGSGTLNWTLAASTADGGNWLGGTPTSGTAPSAVSIAVDVTQLPGGGAVPGEYLGQLVFQTSGDTTTIPVTVTVGAAPFTQLNPLSFTMPFGGANPLSQVVNVAAIDNSTFRFSASVATAKGGNWLSISPSGNACCYTPLAIAASVSASTLAAGNYTAEIIFTEYANPGRSMVLPVNLTIVASGAFFDNLPGALSFSFKTGGTATSQIVQIGNGGTGTLNWTVTTSTADGGAWLTATPTSGTAPSIATISITAANLPNGGLVAGTFAGQLVFQTAGDTTTIPITVTVGTAAFTQMNPISFTMPFGGSNPLPQVLNISAVDESTFRFSASAVTAKGGAWLSVSPSGNACCYTPLALTASVNASTLAAGTYTGEIILTEYANPGRSMIIPVTLTIGASSTAFFDSLSGGLSFSVQPGKKATPQTLLVGNGGAGTLKFTVARSTADGGAWLTVSPLLGSVAHGAPPKALTVSVNVLNLPNGGSIAGTFTGQLLLQAPTGVATVPVTVTVGKAAFAQVNPISFVMPFGGANPLPQVLTIPAADSSTFRFTASASTGKGGNWLSISPSGTACCYTSLPIEVSISASSLAAGYYTGEISILEYANPGRSMTVPVNLAVVASSKAFFDNLPGQTSFSFKPSSTNPPSQTTVVGNGGAGTLNWTVSATTADPGKWITLVPVKGVNSGTYTVSVINSKLPGKGLIAGTFIGQQVLKAPTGNVTIPVVVTVGDPVFVPLPTVTFNTTVGVNPAPQVISVASTSTAIRYTPVATAGKGGNWLSISPSGTACCYTPTNETVSVNSSALAAGTYVAEINVFEYANPGKSMTIPVVLNVH
jgi:Viral BACON domain